MAFRKSTPPGSELLAQQAARWLARRDRGLSSAEQDDYLQWLREDARHGEAVARHEAAVRRMMRLAEWRPALSAAPNPDLFAPPRRRAPWRALVATLAAAAAMVFMATVGSRTPVNFSVADTQGLYMRVNERRALPDGTVVELKDGSRIAVDFSGTERRVRLMEGEAHFTVAPNPARPFVVEAGGRAVRAVGTAFNVRLDPALVEVLVTEGRVRVEPVAVAASSVSRALARELPLVLAGQRVVLPVATGGDSSSPDLPASSMTPAQIADTLAWQAPRLQFFETPLAVAIAEFNRHNRMQLVLSDDSFGKVPIGGTFRIDNVEGFARLLEVTLDLRARRGAQEIVLSGRR